MNTNLLCSNICLYDLKKIYIDFKKDFSYSRKNNYNNNYLYTPIYNHSLIDRIYKMKHLYASDLFVNSDNYIETKPLTFVNGSYSYNTSYMSYYGSYTPYTTSYNNSFNSSFSTSYHSSYRFITSFSSYNSFNFVNSSYNSSYNSIVNYPMINIELYNNTKPSIYKNKYKYELCNIEQNFFVTGYGLELI